MYTGSGISKETQHISPHIAAHKSSLIPTSVSSTTSVAQANTGGPYDLAHHHYHHHPNKSVFNTHIPPYKIGMHQPHHSVVKGLEHEGTSLLGRHGHMGLSTHHSKSAPQDLSAHASGAGKAVPLELTPHSSAHHKPLPHIHTVVSQGVGGSHIGGLVPAHQTERVSPYFRVPDSVISGVQGPSAVLVSSCAEGVSSSPHLNSHTNSMVHSVSTPNSATNLTTMSTATLATTMSVPGAVASTMSQSHMMTNECQAANVSAGCVVPRSDLGGVKKEKVDQLEEMNLAARQRDGSNPEAGPQRDLVRQALQAVVTNPQHKTGNDQEVIEYNYTAGDIAELLMMNIQVNASLQAMNKGNGTPEGEGDMVMLQPAEVDETNSLSSPSQNPKRRRPKLSEEAQAERRIRIAIRMREKRAGESEEQKKLRRLREAERMRRKRATEDDDQKLKRRLEAANRARNRRASMSLEERITDRQKAAERMRMRRATESTDAKTLRRLKAAERMRKRRATETPEQRVERRQNIANRMKARRKRKSEDCMNGDEAEVLNRTISTRQVKAEASNSSQPVSSVSITSVNPSQSESQLVTSSSQQVTSSSQQATSSSQQATSSSQLATSSSHVYVPSTGGTGGGSISVLHVDSALPPMSIGHSATPGLSTVDMTQLGQPLSLQKCSASNHEQKQAVLSHGVLPVSTQGSSFPLPSLASSLHSTLEPLSLHKATSYHHHHIPHLLHYHQPHTTAAPQQQPHHHHHHHHHHHPSHHHLQQRHHQ